MKDGVCLFRTRQRGRLRHGVRAAVLIRNSYAGCCAMKNDDMDEPQNWEDLVKLVRSEGCARVRRTCFNELLGFGTRGRPRTGDAQRQLSKDAIGILSHRLKELPRAKCRFIVLFDARSRDGYRAKGERVLKALRKVVDAISTGQTLPEWHWGDAIGLAQATRIFVEKRGMRAPPE